MNKIINADTYEWLKFVPDNSFDHVITDYEYGTDFPFEELLRVCRGTIITFSSEKDDPFSGRDTERAFWIKTPSTKNYKKHLGRFVEVIHIYRRNTYDVFNSNLHWSNYVGAYTDMVEEKGWEWKKPLSLIERLVRIFTSAGDIVLDPFVGFGTTMEACGNLGRDCVGVEINEERYEYCKRFV